MRRCVPGATAVTFVNKKSSGGPDKKHESNTGVGNRRFLEILTSRLLQRTKSFFFLPSFQYTHSLRTRRRVIMRTIIV